MLFEYGRGGKDSRVHPALHHATWISGVRSQCTLSRDLHYVHYRLYTFPFIIVLIPTYSVW